MIHIVMGLPGTGKTEVAKYLEKRLKGIRINTDELYGHLFPDKLYINSDFPPGRLEHVYNALGALAYYLEKAASEKHYIFEGSFRYKVQREHIFNQFGDKSRIRTVFVEVMDEKEIERRITERHKQGAPDTYEGYVNIKKVFEYPKDYYSIDNSSSLSDLHKMVDEYIKTLK